MAQNGSMVITPFNGVMDSRNPRALGTPAPAPRNQSIFHDFGHSLFVYAGGDDAPWTAYTNTGVWINLLALASGTTSAGSYSWGQFDTYLAQPWPNPTINGDFASNAFNPRSNGQFSGNSYEHFYIMPSNFMDEDVGPPPHSGSVDWAVTRMNQLVDNILAAYPSGQVYLYQHWADGNHYPLQFDMTRATFTDYNNTQMNGYLDWHIRAQNAVQATGRSLNVVPVGAVKAWLFENIPALQARNFNEWYGDRAPHGSENAYFIAALICYRAIFRQNPDVSNFTFPSDALQMFPEVMNNLPEIVSAIETRLQYHEDNGVNVYGE